MTHTHVKLEGNHGGVDVDDETGIIVGGILINTGKTVEQVNDRNRERDAEKPGLMKIGSIWVPYRETAS